MYYYVNTMGCLESLWVEGNECNYWILTLFQELLVISKSSELVCRKIDFVHVLKGYSSGQSHFPEINTKLAEENEFVTHFVQICLETRENEQNVVLNESSEALGNRSEIVRILVLAMTTADDGVGASNSVWEVVARFSLFYKQNGFAKSKGINFSLKDYFDRSICNFQRLARQKNSELK